MLFREFSIAVDRIAQTLDGSERIEEAARLLGRCSTVDELSIAARWLGNGAWPDTSQPAASGATAVRRIYAGLTGETIDEPGTLDHAMFEASRRMAGGTLEAIRLLLQAQGDVPTTAEAGSPLSLVEVAARIELIAARRSPGDRLRLVTELWIRLSPVEIYWLHRSLARSVTQRALPVSELEEAIAITTGGTIEQIRFALMLRGDAGEVAAQAALGAMEEIRLRPMQPLGFMLAERASQHPEAALAQLPRPLADHALEPILPGIRVQAHCWPQSDAPVSLFTRTLKNIAARLPEIVRDLAELPNGTVLDGQIVATDTEGGLVGHEELAGLLRSRRAASASATARFVAFDIMVADGSLLLTEPQHVRRSLLEDVCGRAGLLMVRREAARDAHRVIRLARELVSCGAGGVVLKRLDSVYAFGRRDGAWTKLRVESAVVRAVVRYASVETSGDERRITELTLGIWRQGDGKRQLVNICRTATGPDAGDLFERVAAARLQRFGSTWELAPVIVCDVRFDAVRSNPRTAAGCALVAASIVAIHPHGVTIDSVGSVEELSRFGPVSRAGGFNTLVETPLPFDR